MQIVDAGLTGILTNLLVQIGKQHLSSIHGNRGGPNQIHLCVRES